MIEATANEQPARIQEFDGKNLVFTSPRAFAPGQPITLALTHEPFEVSGKCRGSRRLDDGRFEVRVSTFSLRKEHREALLEALA